MSRFAGACHLSRREETMNRTGFAACVATLGLVLGAGRPAEAQTDTAVGGRVEVVESSGTRVKGRLLEAGQEEVTLAVGREVRRYRWDVLERVSRVERDSLLNGTLIGLGAGFAAGLGTTAYICGTISTRDECGAIGFGVLTLPGAGIGAAVGALIDLAMPQKTTIFAGGARPMRMTLAPDVRPGSRGVRAVVQF
jgi:hypothetical protein